MKNETIRIAMLGMGGMGKNHSNNLRGIEGVEIVAFCSKPIDDAKQYVSENDLQTPVYEDFYKMLEEIEFDALYVCLPPFSHDGQVEAAAAKGKHIFIEKPIALNVDRGESMVKAIQENNVKSQVGYHMRFGSAVKHFVNIIASGESGEPTLYSARYECNSLHSPWWRDVDKCGGQVFEQVIHLYDMALYLMGEADRVSGFTANLCHKETPGYTVEDTSSASLHFKSGAIGSITGSNCSVPGQWNGFFRVICGNMVADFKNENEATFTYTNENEIREETICEDVSAKFEEDVYFIKTIKDEVAEIAPIAEGLDGLRLVSGVVESSQNDGQPVVL